VTVHEPGEFTGDVDTLSGRAALVTGRATARGEVLELTAAALRQAVDALPEIGEIVLKAFLTRRTLLLSDGFEGIKIIGSRFSPDAHRLRDFATRIVLTGAAVPLDAVRGGPWRAQGRTPFSSRRVCLAFSPREMFGADRSNAAPRRSARAPWRSASSMRPSRRLRRRRMCPHRPIEGCCRLITHQRPASRTWCDVLA
jgi:hypothetical protein